MIFNGIEIMFYLLGIITALGVVLMFFFAKKYTMLWFSWLLGIVALFATIFTIAWAWSAILEEEPQSAGVGLLFFGIPSCILIFLTRRMILKSERKKIN